MENTRQYPHYIAVAALLENPRLYQLQTSPLTQAIIPMSVFTLEKEGGILELPCSLLAPSDKSLEEGAFRTLREHFGERASAFPGESLREVRTYLVPGNGGDPEYLVTAFMVTAPQAAEQPLSSPEALRGPGWGWRGLNALSYTVMGRNHNRIVADVINVLSSPGNTSVKSCIDFLSRPLPRDAEILPDGTRLKGLAKRFQENQEDAFKTFIHNLQEMDFHIYPHMHMEVATDIVAFGFSEEDGEDAVDRAPMDEEGKKKKNSEALKSELSVLLVHRAEGAVHGGKWALPGGFLKGKDTADKEARDILIGETGLIPGLGLEPWASHPMKPFTNPNRGEYENTPVITLPHFWVTKKVDLANKSLSSDSTDGCDWFSVKRTLYAGCDSKTEKKVRYGNKVEVLDEETGQYVKESKATKYRVLTDENGMPKTRVYLDDDAKKGRCLYIDYFLDTCPDAFDTNNSKGKERLAFDDHGDIIVAALEEMREQAHFKPLIAGLLPESFPATLFQRIWEVFMWPWTFGRSYWLNSLKKKEPKKGEDAKDDKRGKEGIIQEAEGSNQKKLESSYTLNLEKLIKYLEDNRSIL